PSRRSCPEQEASYHRGMRRRSRLGLGALAERDFRLLFAATTITTIGDRLAVIALAFAVLDLGGATDLGIVLAARLAVSSLVLLAGGVISDRLARNLVLVGASLVQGAAQAATAALVLAGHASVVWLVVLQAAYGVGDGLVVPAETGLVPQTVSPPRLQQANALQGLTRNVTRVLGPIVGAAILAASGVGSVLGGFFALRFRPERPLAASVAFSTVLALQFAALASAAPVWVIAAAAFVAGVGLAVHLALWFTVFQQQVPEHAQSRVSSYDSLGSFVLIPIGYAVVGPVAAAVGVHATLWGAGAFCLACCLAVLALP